MILNLEIVEFARLGGALLGGGGGGVLAEGKRIGELAFRSGTPNLVSIGDLPEDATLVTVSAVGAPAATEAHVEPADYVRVIDMLRGNGVRVDGLISSENGGLATLNGWFQSAVTGVPVVDAACNGRAHPMGVMGSMGLHRIAGYRSMQAAAGGDRHAERYLEMLVCGHLNQAARLIREGAVQAGGMLAVARNPVSAAYVGEHGAVGAISQAIEIGRRLSESLPGRMAAEEVFRFLGGGGIVAEGVVEGFRLATIGGFDVGGLLIQGAQESVELSFCNEYLTLERGSERLATFPDLIATLDPEGGCPVTTAQIRDGIPVLVLAVPKHRLKLGSGVKDPELFRPLEEVTGREIAKYF